MSSADKGFIHFDQIVGQSEETHELIEKIKVVAQHDVSVLIEGESGTGKELVARALHYNSPRKDKEFVVINCSAFSDSLLESELFGYVKGSFTGAVHEKLGLFEVADRGTFFLDEMGDMSPALQVKVLRVLQEGTFFKVGGTKAKQVNVRIIAATNKNLKDLVAKKEFREDLFYRINVVNLKIPPLRSRRSDIPVLTDHILQRICLRNKCGKKELSRDVLDILMKHDWPGNVRELENQLEKAIIFSGDSRVLIPKFFSQDFLSQVKNFEKLLLEESIGKMSLKEMKRQSVEQLERAVIQEGLKRSQGNKTLCAKLLGISRVDLMRKIKRYKKDT